MFTRNRPGSRVESLERALGDNPPSRNGGRSKSRYDAKKSVKKNQVSGYGKIESVAGVLMSPQEIKAMAVCDLSDNPGDKSCIEDPRMGTKNPGEECPTCTNIHGRCNGHFAMMSVPKVAWFLHPWYVEEGIVPAVLNLFCYSCFRFDLRNSPVGIRYETDYVPDVNIKFDAATMRNLNVKYENVTGISRLKQLAEIAIKFPCSSQEGAHTCSIFKKGDNFDVVEVTGKAKPKPMPVDVEVIRLFLIAISNYFERNDNFWFIGFNPIRFENFVITVIPVIPTCSRPANIINNEPKEPDVTSLYFTMLAKIKDIKENEN